MANRSVLITIEEMRALFQKKDSRGKGWIEGTTPGGEIIFDFPLAENCTIRVHTSIHKMLERSASCGRDSIKVAAFDPIARRGLVKAARVHRTVNWRDNLKERVVYVFTEARNRLTR